MQHIAIVTTCTEDWGGCEELWSKSIPYLQKAGFAVSVYKNNINPSHPQYINLLKNNVKLTDLKSIFRIKLKVLKKFAILIQQKNERFKKGFEQISSRNFARRLGYELPQLVIISQSINFDGFEHANVCALLNIPYVLVSQKAVDFYWPFNNHRVNIQQAFAKALHCYFVSKHNLTLTEEMLGMRFSNASVIFNPVKIRDIVTYPDSSNGFHLACVGRLFILDKGQDILLRVLAQQKWKQRQVSISFIGAGNDDNGLKAMAQLLDIKNVKFVGYESDFTAICNTHHAFILPSRSEGLPLVVAEGMAAGRIVIVTDAGGNKEIVEEGKTGYIAPFINEVSLDEAMERAWRNRENWDVMGKAASAFINAHIPICPEKDFADQLLRHMQIMAVKQPLT